MAVAQSIIWAVGADGADFLHFGNQSAYLGRLELPAEKAVREVACMTIYPGVSGSDLKALSDWALHSHRVILAMANGSGAQFQ